MKAPKIHFFKQEDNSETPAKSTPKAKEVPATGYISSTGKLVFPIKSVTQLGLEPDGISFQIGTQEGKRKIKSLYVVPTSEETNETFQMEKGAKSYTIPLPVILQKGKIDYSGTKYVFTIKPFDYEGDITGYELQLEPETKPEYTGKPRGRKKSVATEE
ncbi:hypothetical protein [Spirosoma sp. KUDC1026]|uniref:hypothetical protein n=1 Tax=Spirosoma sp. KUDC1026 TaxID=2745947 RepID=UPI00159B95C5|nr:hypothetical protein [Spirosoma sp. KUDC1026]QKZ13904.1 hypothetical protein HU175_15190 [Spirosoma sp. KUDC1026]